MKTSERSLSLGEFIQTHGYGLIDFDISHLWQGVLEGWNSFLGESLDYRKKWTIPSQDEKEGPDNGYVPRDGKNGYDVKDWFHYRPCLPLLLWEQQGVVIPEKYRQWLRHCDRLYRACLAQAMRVAGNLNEIGTGRRFDHMMDDPFAACNHALRLLSYINDPTPGKELAHDHADRCFLTLHVWENMPGLELELPDKTKIPYTATPGKILAFTGKKAAKATEGILRACHHGVRGREGVNSQKKRQSIVFFAHIDS